MSRSRPAVPPSLGSGARLRRRRRTLDGRAGDAPSFAPFPYLALVVLALPIALLAGCGGEAPVDDPSPASETWVAAVPSGRSFASELSVRLESSPADARIHYTLDGSSPLGAEARVYEAPLLITRDTLLAFAAETPDGRWSAPATALYRHEPPPAPFAPPIRGLEISDDNVFFTADPEDELLERVIVVRSVGVLPVRIARVALVAGGFHEEGVFAVRPAIEALDLPPGQSLELVVSYRPRETLRTAALVLDTNDERAPDGRWVVTLGGRIAAW